MTERYLSFLRCDGLHTVELSGADRDGQDIHLIFEGASDIKVGDLGGRCLLQLSITDIADWQREGINLRVVEEEHGVISFDCRNVVVSDGGPGVRLGK